MTDLRRSEDVERDVRIMQKYMAFQNEFAKKMSARRNDTGGGNPSLFSLSSRGQGRIVSLLRERGSMSQRELAQELHVQPQSTSEMVHKLERKGLIQRTRSDYDARVFVVRLTDAGAELAEGMLRTKPMLLNVLTDEEKLQFEHVLDKLLDAIETGGVID